MQEERKLYQQKLEAKVKELRAEIDKLNAKIEGAEADTKLRYRKERNSLEERLDQTQEKIKDLRSAGMEAWEEIRQGSEKALKELNQALENAREKF